MSDDSFDNWMWPMWVIALIFWCLVNPILFIPVFFIGILILLFTKLRKYRIHELPSREAKQNILKATQVKLQGTMPGQLQSNKSRPVRTFKNKKSIRA